MHPIIVYDTLHPSFEYFNFLLRRHCTKIKFQNYPLKYIKQ